MNQKIKKFISIIMSIITMLTLLVGTQVFATAKRETIKVAKNQVWNKRPAVSRTCKYSDLRVRTYAVYPTDGRKDTFSCIQVTARNTSGVRIVQNEYYKIYETKSSTPTSMKIREGYLNTKSVVFAFRGNSTYSAAYADVKYNAR